MVAPLDHSGHGCGATRETLQRSCLFEGAPPPSCYLSVGLLGISAELIAF